MWGTISKRTRKFCKRELFKWGRFSTGLCKRWGEDFAGGGGAGVCRGGSKKNINCLLSLSCDF